MYQSKDSAICRLSFQRRPNSIYQRQIERQIASMGHPKDQLIFVGTYTNLGAKGIYTCHMDGATGRLTELSVATDSAQIHHSSLFTRTANSSTRLPKSTISRAMMLAVSTHTPSAITESYPSSTKSRPKAPAHATSSSRQMVSTCSSPTTQAVASQCSRSTTTGA